MSDKNLELIKILIIAAAIIIASLLISNAIENAGANIARMLVQ